MPAPVKNYSDPTNGPLKWVGVLPFNPLGTSTPLPSRSSAHMVTTTSISGVRIPLRGLLMAQYKPEQAAVPTPTPPMGTIKMATFPAIYFRKASSRPPTGQLWPRTR